MWKLAEFFPSLIGFLVSAAGSIVGSALLALGIGVVSYAGFDLLLSTVMSEVQSNFSGLPSDMIVIMSLLQIDTCFSILTSAGLIKLSLSGLRSGTMKKFTFK